MDLLALPEIAAILKTSEGIALQIMADTPYLHLGSGNGNSEARGSHPPSSPPKITGS